MAEIRSYQNADFQLVRQILELGNLFYERTDNEQELERKIKRDPNSILVAMEDGKIVGTEFIVEDFMSFLFRLAVHPDYRRRGIGKALMQKGEEILRQRGHRDVNILVAAEDEELQNLYERFGYEKGHKYVWMVKEF